MTKGGSTKGLHKLFAIHTNKNIKDKNTKISESHQTEIISDEERNEDGPSTSSKQRKITDFFLSEDGTVEKLENSLDTVIARMAAVDGFPFRVFITSIDLRKGLEARGLKTFPFHLLQYRKRISGNDYEHEQADADDNETDEVKENDETGSLDVVDDSEEEIELTMESCKNI
ncbi:hypothetical protein QE152_g25785 [Popillia japonica]|uniref:Uncharacterized protein n=1 Tax=Popillia japonica TaxID=7064 RepID=A0AAW1K0E0_POPJA